MYLTGWEAPSRIGGPARSKNPRGGLVGGGRLGAPHRGVDVANCPSSDRARSSEGSSGTGGVASGMSAEITGFAASR